VYRAPPRERKVNCSQRIVRRYVAVATQPYVILCTSLQSSFICSNRSCCLELSFARGAMYSRSLNFLATPQSKLNCFISHYSLPHLDTIISAFTVLNFFLFCSFYCILFKLFCVSSNSFSTSVVKCLCSCFIRCAV